MGVASRNEIFNFLAQNPRMSSKNIPSSILQVSNVKHVATAVSKRPAQSAEINGPTPPC